MTEAPAAPVPTPTTDAEASSIIDRMAADAAKRMQSFINRSAAQHSRQMRKEWEKRAEAALIEGYGLGTPAP